MAPRNSVLPLNSGACVLHITLLFLFIDIQWGERIETPDLVVVNPFSIAVPFWGQSTWNVSGLSPQRDSVERNTEECMHCYSSTRQHLRHALFRTGIKLFHVRQGVFYPNFSQHSVFSHVLSQTFPAPLWTEM